MKQKVQIDVLDVSLADIGRNIEKKQTDSAFFDLFKKKNNFWKSKIIIILICSVIISLFLGFTFIFFHQYHSNIKKLHINKKEPSHMITQPQLTTLGDFIINFKDGFGKEKIFVCALVLETSSDNKNLIKGNYLEIRKMIYKKLQKYSFENLSLFHDKKKLKDEISVEINKQLGIRIISGIYFTKFIIL